ncbi:MAG: beta-ketoacyl synthase N-terminal-like domain-containing protein [Desulfobacterales bacterium]
MKKRTPIAVVGMAGLFPGALDLNGFWQNIVNKVDSTSEVPADRWIVDPDAMFDPDYMPDKTFSKRACLIHDFKFDPEGIDLEKDLLQALDPLYHLVLHTGREALSSCVTTSINKKNIGIVLAAIALPTDASSSITRKILGASFEEKLFGNIAPDKYEPLSREQCLAGRVTSLPGALLAEGLGLGGGSYTLDAACASSLYAVKLACDELWSFRADAMLAGGVSRPECLYTQVGFSQLRALSPSGRCAPFDESADGLVVGEGAGILVLKRLDDALRDQDNIYALIQGVGLSNDMRGNLLAPDSEGQVRAMRSAYSAAGWSPQDVDLIECHGAGTPVGDVVELQSLRNLWGESDWSKEQCAIGSVKSMVGHLLTGAGAAGMVKTLLAIKHKILPPSLNFNKTPAKSPLHNSPFRVQTEAEEWVRRDANTPLRAAVSAFGFGGINSHLLFEEWDPKIENHRSKIEIYKSSLANTRPEPDLPESSGKSPDMPDMKDQQNHEYAQGLSRRGEGQSSIPIAIIGMASVFGTLKSLNEFQKIIFKGESIIAKRPEARWNGCENIADSLIDGRAAWGGFMNELSFYIGEFHIPPNEIPDILLQHLLMLKVSSNAMEDAELPLRKDRPRMGALIGIDFDFEATDFHLRWNLHNSVKEWKKRYSTVLGLDDDEKTALWLKSLRDECRPPLTASRTLGALGGIIASRIAREFRFGGPSFVVSNEAASGLKALEIGVRSLQQNETDAVLVGAVDLCGDVRSVITLNQIRPYTKNHKVCPFDQSADGTLPGEGASALVLKRLDQAIKDGDRIYSVIKGIGNASGGGVKTNTPSKNAYILSLKRSFQDAGISPSSVSFVETHGSGNTIEDRIESEALNEFIGYRKEPCAIGSIKPNLGHAGAASGLASLVKTSLCLYHETIPPLMNYVNPGNQIQPNDSFHMPASPQYWIKDKKDGPRRACTGAMTTDGICMHVILEGFEYESLDQMPEKVARERKRPPIANGAPAELDKLYGSDVSDPTSSKTFNSKSGRQITLVVGGKTPSPSLPPTDDRGKKSEIKRQSSEDRSQKPVHRIQYSEMMNAMAESIETTNDAHKTFLDFSNELINGFEKTFAIQAQLLDTITADNNLQVKAPDTDRKAERAERIVQTEPAFSRYMCMEFATGSVARVLGPDFAVVDTYKVRVRLPDEPLMLVDRIISVEGEKGSLGSGRLVTEHDVLPEAWYLDGGCAPVCISVEAGQADLFLCSYLGIDHAVKGERSYRLLDAIVKFHRGLPRPGDVIRYEIEIDHFVRQGDTFLFFFRFEGFIGNTPLISMYNGCAGFFTEEEVRNSGGIILTEEDTRRLPGKKTSDWVDLVPLYADSYDDKGVEALRHGDLTKCFGPLFEGIELSESLKLPGGRMKLINRVPVIDPEGGRYGLGLIRAEADIHPDDWFLTCHFMDDMVMPGTLMYECCAHTLRVFIQRIGWVTEKPEVCYEPVVGVESVLKCRGPVTPDTRHVHYEVEIKEIGYAPEPYVIADALMYADGQRIVSFKDMSMKMTGITREEIVATWEKVKDIRQIAEDGEQKKETSSKPPAPDTLPQTFYDRDRILAFAVGKPSKAFGDPYKVFDKERIIARLPGPPYSFMDRVVSVNPQAWVLKPDGWIEAEYDVPSDAWYFKADRSSSMPFCVLLEIALQPCGWLAAYLGSALRSEKDLKFRNLGGNAVLNRIILPEEKRLTMRTRMTKVSEAGEMIIEHFDFKVFQDDEIVYSGETYFGFFSKEALSQQVGIRGAEQQAYCPTHDEMERADSYIFENQAPLWPDDPEEHPSPSLAMPSNALRMIDRVESYVPDGGPEGLGFIRGVKEVDPDEWFFKAHFYQDPVCPGSLGIESFLQLVKFIAIDRWKHFSDSHRFELVTDNPHNWIYRGQVTPKNKKIEVEALITKIVDTPAPTIYANGFLKVDGLYIYQMENFGFRLVPI